MLSLVRCVMLDSRGKVAFVGFAEKRMLWLTIARPDSFCAFLWIVLRAPGRACAKMRNAGPEWLGAGESSFSDRGLANQFAARTGRQSRSNSLIEVLERVRSSTVFTMTAQLIEGRPSPNGLGIEPGMMTE